jgi:trans-aconitate 2-methyltransferase
VDLIFSTATFHWIKDHDRLFRRLAQALKPQGRLVAQCGGKGNTARTQNAMEQGMGDGRFPKFFTGLEDPWNFAAAKTTKARLKAAGFGEVNNLAARGAHGVRFDGRAGPLPENGRVGPPPREAAGVREGEHFAAMVAARLAHRGELVVDYVRLNILAKREVGA